jgi:hypothetical protein
MEKKLTVKTKSGKKSYKITDSGSSHICYYHSGSILSGWTSIGKAKSLDDAVSVIKSHAASFGTILGLEFD